jgi:hypothetical protein
MAFLGVLASASARHSERRLIEMIGYFGFVLPKPPLLLLFSAVYP